MINFGTRWVPDGTTACSWPHGTANVRWRLYSGVRHLCQTLMGAVHNSPNAIRDHSPLGNQDLVITPFMAKLIHWDGNRFEIFDCKMENEHANSSFPRPSAVYCSPTVRLSSERTVTGKCTKLHGCLVLGDNIHFSIAGNCMCQSGIWLENLLRNPIASPLFHSTNAQLGSQHSFSFPATIDSMPRLRHRMRCRRGQSRRVNRRSSPSSSTSAADFIGSASTSHVARGRILRSENWNTNCQNAPAHSQTRHFFFQSALIRPCLTATVTIVFRESLNDEVPVDEGQVCLGEQNDEDMPEQYRASTEDVEGQGNGLNVDIEMIQEEKHNAIQDRDNAKCSAPATSG